MELETQNKVVFFAFIAVIVIVFTPVFFSANQAEQEEINSTEIHEVSNTDYEKQICAE
jgi:hypothetical protein